MIRVVFVILLALPVMISCNKTSYRKTAGGMPYKLFPGEGGPKIMPGNVVKVHLTQKINDSVYFDTQGKLPIYFPIISSMDRKYDLAELWTQLRKGDSVVATQMMDTFIARNPSSVPPEFKKGDRIITLVKVLDIFPNDSIAQIDNKKIQDAWLNNEIQYVSSWLAEKKINAVKTPSGAFVEIKNPGTGALIDSGDYITVNYTGTSWSGEVFDSNVDTAFHHAQPYSYVTGIGQMIKGFDEGMRLLRKGASARFYVPSVLGYGANSGHPKIKPYEHLIFDIEILNVQDKAPEQNQMTPPGH